MIIIIYFVLNTVVSLLTFSSALCVCVSYLLWWKSWASGEGKNGRWKPQWATVVLATARNNHSHCDAKWLPKQPPSNIGPAVIGNELTKKCSKGWQ